MGHRPVLLLLAVVATAAASMWPPAQSRYDVVILGAGLKESLLAGLLATRGKSVLQLESPGELSGSLDLQQLSELTEGPDAPPLSVSKLGKPSEYRVERSPKMVIASGEQLDLLVQSGAWQHMNPPGFKRVHRALMYRIRPDGKPDIHRVLANGEDVVKTRSLSPLEKARVVQFFLWVERYDEGDSRTHFSGALSKKVLNLHKMNTVSFLRFWELPESAVAMVVRGMALQTASTKQLKKIPSIELVRRLKRYKNAYRTFPHMTSPYVYPVGGFGDGLGSAMSKVVKAHGGSLVRGVTLEGLLTDADGCCAGVTAGGVSVEAGCVIAGAESIPERATPRYEIVRLYAVLAHPPNLCKDSTSCQLIVPGAQCSRAHDVYLSSYGSIHGVAPKDKWVVVAQTRVEGHTEGLAPLAIARRELSAILPLLKPARKLLAEVVPYYEPAADAQLKGLHVLRSSDETSYFDSTAEDIEDVLRKVIA